MVSALYSALLAATIVLCLAQLVPAVVGRRDVAAFPVVAATMWLYFYGLMAVSAATTLRDHLPDWTLELGQAMALASYCALLAGWAWGRRRSGRCAVARDADFNPRLLWYLGLAMVLLGSTSYYVLLGAQGEIDWQATSAYWYMAYHVAYPGAALCLIASSRDPALRRTRFRVVLALVIAYSMFPHVINARRGPLFPMIVVLLFVPALLEPRRRRIGAIVGLVGAGAAMLLFVAIRPWLSDYSASSLEPGRGAQWSQGLRELTFQEAFVARTRQTGDNEYVYHCGAIATNLEHSLYQYGTGYVSTLLNWIPRTVWPEKPGLGEGWFRPSVQEEIRSVMGWDMTSGASSGGIAEVFNEFGFASVLFWLALGYGAARLHRRAQSEPPGRSMVAYVGLLCATHWLISQGVAAAFVPAVIYQLAPVAAFRLARRGSEFRRHA